jgi:hypothetical protein
MNERIKELVLLAGTDTSGKWMSMDHAEKFAEAIVKECIYYAFCHGDDIDYVKKHFGVKE